MSHQSVALHDIELHFDVRGDGEPLILLHGGGGVGSNWSVLFPEPPAGFRLVIPDLRGHGKSTNPSGQFTFRQFALDVLALLDHLEIERCKAIGVSLGAKTLLHVATQQPARLDAMVLASAAPYFPEQARALMRDVRPDNRTDAEWKQMRSWHRDDDQIRALWGMARAFAEDHDDHNFTPLQLSTITARTLIVHGDRDELYPVRLAVELYESIQRASLWVVPNAGHGLIFGAMAAQFVATALAFLSEDAIP